MLGALNFTSIQAANADPVCVAITGYVAGQLNTTAKYFALGAWQERERAFDANVVQVCWMCGAVYARKLARKEAEVELLAAPVMGAPRYGDRPIYFSDVIVRAESRYKTFRELRGASWAYNEPNSHSGYTVTRWYLAKNGYGNGFFERVVGSGAHQRSLQMVLEGEVDASAIDSTVLETELIRRPELAGQLRIVESFGPSPIPPWVMQANLPAKVKASLRIAFSQMHQTEAGRKVLAKGQIDHFDLVSDRDYEPIRQMAEIAKQVTLE